MKTETEHQDELNRLRTRAERAEAACAEMREVIDDNMFADNSGGEYRSACFCFETANNIHEPDCKAAHALSTDCGKGWLSPDAQAQLVTRMADLFLCEPLPESVCVDRCALARGWPNRIGTNLLTAVEARQMFESVFKKALRETEVKQ